MIEDRNSAIKDYICRLFAQEDEHLATAKMRARDADLPNIAIPSHVGKLLSFFARLQKPKRILEVGTLAGYSTLWLAKGAPDAEIITLENNPEHASIARENLKGFSQVRIIEDDALKVLKELTGPFDLIFLDADKEGYPLYLPHLISLSRPGTLLLTDNLIPKAGTIENPHPKDQIAHKTYEYNQILSSHPQIETVLATTLVGDNARIDALGISIIS